MKHLKNFRIFEEAPPFDIEHPSISGGYMKKGFTSSEIRFLRKYDKDLEAVTSDGEIHEIVFNEESTSGVRFKVKVVKVKNGYQVLFETLDGKSLPVFAWRNSNIKKVNDLESIPLVIRDGIIAANKFTPPDDEPNPHDWEEFR